MAPDPRLVTSRVFTLPPYVLLPAGHKLAGRSKVTLAQLVGEPLALLDLPQSRDYFLGMFAAAGVEPDIRYRSSSVETLRALVGRGLAYTLLNRQPAAATSLDGNPVVSLAGREAARRWKSYWSPPPAAAPPAAPRRSPPKPRSTGRVWMVAGRNQRPADLILAVNRAWVSCRLPVLRLVRGSWLGFRGSGGR